MAFGVLTHQSGVCMRHARVGKAVWGEHPRSSSFLAGGREGASPADSMAFREAVGTD